MTTTSYEALRDLGLGEQESEVYLTLLRIGASPASSIAKEINAKRTTVYAILESMLQRGLVHLLHKQKKRLYRAEKPQHLAATFEKKLESFTALIPQLTTLAQPQRSQIGLRFIETKKELERFYNIILSEYRNREYRIIGSSTAWQDINRDFFQKFRHGRAKANIRTKLLLTEESRAVNPIDPTLLRDVRFLPNKYTFRSTIDIFDDKILIVGPDITGLAVVIEVPAMVDIFSSLFEMLWEQVGK